MTREEIVNSLRCCARETCDESAFWSDDSSGIHKMKDASADLIENQQREIEALRQANEGLRFNLAEKDGGEICRGALDTFGAEAQVMMAIEEMSELTKELCKYRRGRDNVEAIAEEIADVEIMLRQMMLLFDCREDVDKFCRYKLERLARRVEEAKQ